MSKIALTEAQVSKAHKKGAGDKPMSYTFHGHSGLSLTVGKSKSSWQLRKREPDTGRLVAITLGDYPTLTHMTVQTKRLEVLKGIEESGRYIELKQDDDVPTFLQAFERYIERKNSTKKGLKQKTEDDYRRQVMNNLKRLRSMPVDTISRDDLQRMFDSGKPFKDHLGHTATAWACRRVVAAVLGDCDEVAAQPTKKLNMDPPRERITMIEDENDGSWQIGELMDLWTEIESLYNNPRKNPGLPNLWAFGLFTGIRMSAVLGLTWDRIDFDKKTVRMRAEDQKNGVARTLPLSDYAIDILLQQRPISAALSGNTNLVFPSNRLNKDGSRRMYQVRRLENGSFHETRHHFSTAASNAGLSDYQWAFLRGDVLHAGNSGQARMARVYKHEATHDEANKVSAQILQAVGEGDDRHALPELEGAVWSEAGPLKVAV